MLQKRKDLDNCVGVVWLFVLFEKYRIKIPALCLFIDRGPQDEFDAHGERVREERRATEAGDCWS